MLTEAGWSPYLSGMHSGHCLIRTDVPEVVQTLRQWPGGKEEWCWKANQLTISGFVCVFQRLFVVMPQVAVEDMRDALDVLVLIPDGNYIIKLL